MTEPEVSERPPAAGAARARPRWWEGMAPVDVPGPEGAETHRLQWREGELVLPSHPDPDAEQALIALGGERCACLDVRDAWEAQHAQPEILSVGAKFANESVDLNTRVAGQLRSEIRRWRAHLSALRAQARRRADQGALDRLAQAAAPAERAAVQKLGVLQVMSLPPVLQLRLQASVAAGLVESGRLDRLVVPTAARAQPFLNELGFLGRVSDIELTADVAGAVVEEERAVLPVGWLPEVWGRGLGIVDDALVVAVTGVEGDGSVLEVVAVELGKPGVDLRVVRWENDGRPD
ncbi:MAG TPA: hypothetical protein VFO65_12670 [Acidimicrobiales bacterium]|nr:hypothetical protein [Acidimicrobiales bacterium]